jgi:hypothetical protein
VTGSSAGYASSTQTSLEATVANGSIPVTPVPSISGLVKVREIVTAVPGSWSQGVSLSYQWLRDGAAISGATLSSYTLVPSDAGRQISVSVTGSSAGYASSTQTSLSRITPLQSMTTSVPTILGTPQIGKSLKVQTRTWSPGARISYQWLVDGKVLKGSTTSTLKISSTQRGRKISVRVTQFCAGFTTSSSTSLPKKVQ